MGRFGFLLLLGLELRTNDDSVLGFGRKRDRGRPFPRRRRRVREPGAPPDDRKVASVLEGVQVQDRAVRGLALRGGRLDRLGPGPGRELGPGHVDRS